MFGNTIDYHVLRPFTHDRRMRTGHGSATVEPTYSPDDARNYLTKAKTLYFDNALPVDPKLSYLDVGCGPGQLSVALSLAGVNDVTGVDVSAQSLRQATAVADRLPVHSRPAFINASIHDLTIERRYDVVLVLAVLEHIDRPALFLRRLSTLLKPSGRAFVSMTPFHGPLGDHMSKFFRVRIPWRGVLFSEQAILRLRRERYRPDEIVARYQDLPTGLNLLRISEYLRHIDDAGLTARHIWDPHFKFYARLWPLFPFSWCATRTPKIRDYFTFNVYSILQKAGPDG